MGQKIRMKPKGHSIYCSRDPTQPRGENRRNTRRHFDSLVLWTLSLTAASASAWFIHSLIPALLERKMEETQLNSNKPRMMETGAATPNEGGGGRSYYKTQLCRRFMEGTCPHGHKCTYAHGFSDLRRTNHHEPKICRMFSLSKHCTYGHSCRFLHSSDHHHHHQFNNALLDPPAHPQPQPGGGKNEGSSSAGYRAMQTSTAANPSTNTVATSSLHKNEDPYRVKFIFKENNMRKINGIYADWI